MTAPTTTSLKKFIEHIEENIYKKQLIYRSLLVCRNIKECRIIAEQMAMKDYSVLVVESISSNIDYNNIDNRIVILTYNKFKDFILQLQKDNMGGLLMSSYNFIGLSFWLPDNIVDDLIMFYMKLTNNNANDTIFLDKRLVRLSYLKKLLY